MNKTSWNEFCSMLREQDCTHYFEKENLGIVVVQENIYFVRYIPSIGWVNMSSMISQKINPKEISIEVLKGFESFKSYLKTIIEESDE